MVTGGEYAGLTTLLRTTARSLLQLYTPPGVSDEREAALIEFIWTLDARQLIGCMPQFHDRLTSMRSLYMTDDIPISLVLWDHDDYTVGQLDALLRRRINNITVAWKTTTVLPVWMYDVYSRRAGGVAPNDDTALRREVAKQSIKVTRANTAREALVIAQGMGSAARIATCNLIRNRMELPERT